MRKTYKFTDFACPFGILIVTTESKKLNSNTETTSIHNDIELFTTERSRSVDGSKQTNASGRSRHTFQLIFLAVSELLNVWIDAMPKPISLFSLRKSSFSCKMEKRFAGNARERSFCLPKKNLFALNWITRHFDKLSFNLWSQIQVIRNRVNTTVSVATERERERETCTNPIINRSNANFYRQLDYTHSIKRFTIFSPWICMKRQRGERE